MQSKDTARGTGRLFTVNNRWLYVGGSFAIFALWLVPLVRPQGAYAGHYRFFDLELNFVATIIGIATLFVALTSSPKRRIRAFQVSTALVSTFCTIAVCDLSFVVWQAKAVRFTYFGLEFSRYENMPDSELIWKHRPGYSWRGRKTPDCESIDFRTDENGFRNPSGMRRADVVFIGDSVTEAGEVRDEATFVRMTALDLDLSAVNLGVFGYGPQQELAVLRRFGFGYQPRVVVWELTPWNDLADAELYEARETPDRSRPPSFRTMYERHSLVVRFLGMLFPVKRRDLVEFVTTDGTVDQRAIWPFVDVAEKHKKGLQITLNVLAEARQLCQERGIDFVVLLVPEHQRILAPYLRFKDERSRTRYVPKDEFDNSDGLSRALRLFSVNNECPVLDLTGPLRRRAAIDNRDVYVRNDTHLGRAGHNEVALSLVQCLKSDTRLAFRQGKKP